MKKAESSWPDFLKDGRIVTQENQGCLLETIKEGKVTVKDGSAI